LYEANATGKLSDRHYARLLSEYDGEQSALETTIAELQGKVNTWSEEKSKIDSFIELVKRYTDFSELTAAMVNEFIERAVVHEGEGRGLKRRVRVDIYLNFIGAFEVPAEIVTPMEIEEQRLIQEEKAEKEKMLIESERERYEKLKAKKRVFTARRKAGLLTPEKTEAYELQQQKRREWQKQWRNKKKAARPPKPLSRNEIIRRKGAGLPLTTDEYEVYELWKNKRTEQHRAWRLKQKATNSLPTAANQ
jgi:hypothetical protein